MNQHASSISVTNNSNGDGDTAVATSMVQQQPLPPSSTITETSSASSSTNTTPTTPTTNYSSHYPVTTATHTLSEQQPAYMPPNTSPSVKQDIQGYSPNNNARSHTGFTSMSQPTTPRPTSEVPTSYHTPPEENDQSPSSTKQPITTTTTSSPPPHYPQNDHQQQQNQSQTGVYSQDANALVRRRRKESVYFQEDSPVFTPTRYKRNIYALDRNTLLDVQIHARIDRGFFLAENDWTCYRRNYFQLSGAFNLQGIGVIYDGQELPCLVQHNEQLHPISSFMLGVTARIANSEKVIPLIQHTPKRDKGPQNTPDPKPIRPGGNIAMSTVGATQSVVTFERVQFKSATANNGKRRAAQQYYLVVVDLYAQLTSGELVQVGTVESSPLVVRGRSPGHYAEADASHQQQQQQDQQTMNYGRFVGFPPQQSQQAGNSNNSGDYSNNGNGNYNYPPGAAPPPPVSYPHPNMMPPPPPPPHGSMVPPPYHHPPHPHYAVHERTTSTNSSSSEMHEYENGHVRYPPPPPMEHWGPRMRMPSTSSTSSVDHSQQSSQQPPPQQHNYEQHYSHPSYYDGRSGGMSMMHHPSLPPPMPSSSSGYHNAPSYASMQPQPWRASPVPPQESRYQYNNNNTSPVSPSEQKQSIESDARSCVEKSTVKEQSNQDSKVYEKEPTHANNKRDQDDISSTSSPRAAKSRRTKRKQ